jgi:hypothetical protein
MCVAQDAYQPIVPRYQGSGEVHSVEPSSMMRA